MTPRIYLARMMAKLNAIFGQGQIVSISVILVIAVAVGMVVFMFVNFAAPNTITIASGPNGSVFRSNAEKYKKILAREGVTLNILPSEGSMDNFKKLSNPKVAVDVGFVLGGEVNGADIGNLVSLGSISYQPLMIFYGGESKSLLSDFKGLRLDIGQDGSGTHSLALTLLKANGIEPDGSTIFVDTVPGDLARALLENRIDAIFVMGDSTSTDLMRQLLHSPNIRLFNFTQADGYTRRINYLNKLELPKGSLDFGKDIPAEDTYLIGPTVELIARTSLHPALSDLLLEAAREVHGAPGLFKRRGEFPSPQEHEFRISPDASRYYISGKSFLYRTFPFGIASLVARVLAVIVPIALLLIPALKVAPAIYRWRIESRIHRWYRALLDLERDAFKPSVDPKRREELMRNLDHIENAVSKIIVPASFGDLFYGLREHVGFVRNRLLSQYSVLKPESNPATKNHDGRDAELGRSFVNAGTGCHECERRAALSLAVVLARMMHLRLISEFGVPIRAASFRRVVKQVPERPDRIHVPAILLRLGRGKLKFGTVRMMNCAVATGKHVERGTVFVPLGGETHVMQRARSGFVFGRFRFNFHPGVSLE